MDPILGTVTVFAFSWAPQGWLPCDGRLVPLNQYVNVFSLIGTAFGGDGRTNFGLPDLRGRVVIGAGAGGSQPAYGFSAVGGANSVTLSLQNLAPHAHTGTLAVSASTRGPEAPAPGNILQSINNTLPGSTTGTVPLGGVTTNSTGGGQPFSIMPPYVALNVCIAVSGQYPIRP